MDNAPLTEPPVSGPEADTLLGALERNRRTFAWKCGGLDSAGLNKQLPPSTVTLGGLLKHLALVEDEYFTRRLLGKELPEPWDSVDWDADPDFDWHSAADDSPEELMDLWQAAVARSRAAVTEVLATGASTNWLSTRAATATRRACATSSSTSSRSTPATPATPT